MKAMLILCCCLLISSQSYAKNPPQVATNLPVLQLITQQLTTDTPVEVSYLPPRRYPVNRIPSWLQHKANQKLDRQLAFDALITVESIWPEFSSYPLLRSRNIRLVQIDAARQLIPGGAKVVLAREQQQGYFWLAPDNLLVMANIISQELARMWPEYQLQLERNRGKLAADIRRYSLQLDNLLATALIDELVIDIPQLTPLVQATSLPLVKGDSPAFGNRLMIAAKQRKKVSYNHPVWYMEALQRLPKTTLPEVLADNLKRLEVALTGHHQG